MIHIASDFDTARPYDGSGAPALPAGGHICRIVNAKMELAKSGAEMLVVAFDIQEGSDYDGFYAKLYDSRSKRNANAKWPGVFRSSILNKDGGTNSYFKGLITAVEESNPGYSFKGSGCEEATLKNKWVGFNFGEEEWLRNDSTVGVDVKPFYAVSVKHVREGIEPPPRKKLKQDAMQAQGFTEVHEKLPWED